MDSLVNNRRSYLIRSGRLLIFTIKRQTAHVPNTMSTTTTSDNTQPLLGVHVSISISPADVTAFLAALKPCQQGCASEKECLFFDVFHDGQGNFRFMEIWVGDEEWFRRVQFAKPYYEPYTSITQPMWTKERVIEFRPQVPGWLKVKKAYVEPGLIN